MEQSGCSLGSRSDLPNHKEAACVPVDATAMDRILKVLDIGGSSILNKERAVRFTISRNVTTRKSSLPII